jgi:regulator of protease activity HflC (stomatin/prohibitin superfamily)
MSRRRILAGFVLLWLASGVYIVPGDQNIIPMRVVVQYWVGVPADFLFQAADVARRTVGAVVESALAGRIGSSTVDTVLTTEKAAIQEEVRAADVNGRRLYVETMEQVLPRMKKLIVDRNGNLDVTIIRKGDSPPPQE